MNDKSDYNKPLVNEILDLISFAKIRLEEISLENFFSVCSVQTACRIRHLLLDVEHELVNCQ